MLRVEKVATPAAAETVVVPARVAFGLAVPPLNASVTAPVNTVTVLPKPSSTATCTAGVSVAPAVVVAGCPVTASFTAALGVIANAALVAPASPLAAAVSVYPVATLSMLKPVNVATPAAAGTVVAPPNVALGLPVPLVMATDTFPVKAVTVL